MQMAPRERRKRHVVILGDLEVVELRMAGARGIDTEDQHGTRLFGVVCGAAMNCERGARRDVSPLRELALSERGIARELRLVREHPVLELVPRLVLRAFCDLEGAHVGRGVHGSQIEGERSEAPVAVRLHGRREVAVPGLVHRASEWNVEADLDNFVIRAEHRPAHRHEPRMSDEIDETPERLRMDLDIIPVGAAPDCAARALDCVRECSHDVLAHRVCPLGAEGTFEPRDTFFGESAHVLRNVVSTRVVLRRQHSCVLLAAGSRPRFPSANAGPQGTHSAPMWESCTPCEAGEGRRGTEQTPAVGRYGQRYSCNGSHAEETISRRSWSRGFHPSSAAIRVELATSTAGSPARRGPILTGIARLVTERATSITCLTLYPAPPQPRLYAPPAWPRARASSASTWARDRSLTWM